MTVLRNISIFLICVLTSGWAAEAVAQPPIFDTAQNKEHSDSIHTQEESIDSIDGSSSTMLEEFTIEGIGKRELINHNGSMLKLNSAMMSEMPTILGGGDMLSAIRSAAPVATASDLTATFSVMGLPTGSNLYTSNGVRLGNPLHLLGLYSTYTPGLHDLYTINTFPGICLPYNTSAVSMDAVTDKAPITTAGGSAFIGLIESHANINIPISHKHPTSVKIAIRQSYLDKVFPELLKAGTSSLGYSFTDGGAEVCSHLSSKDILAISFTGSRDRLTMRNERGGRKEASAGWSNLAGGASITHSRLTGGIGLTYFNNFFQIEEGMQSIKLPSSLTEMTTYFDLCLDKGWRVHIDGHLRHTSGQYNETATLPSDMTIPGRSTAFELNIAAAWTKHISKILDMHAGLRLSGYTCGRDADAYTKIIPQPRIAVELKMPGDISLSASYGRLVRFERLLEESATGMPVNFFINSDQEVKYEDNHSLELNVSGILPLLLVEWKVDGYWIRMINASEYSGGLLNFINKGYDPVSDLHYGNGYSAGFSVTFMRQWGNLRGRARYAFGKSRVRIPYFSSEYFPTSHDRTHDLSIGLTWQFLKSFSLSGNFTYATGTPYTKAKYGYIIGENLICEYYPHNSSRLPAYKRLDLSLNYKLKGKKISQEFNISVYNALASRNILFIYNSYSPDNGIKIRESAMNSVIPSVAYTIHF